MKKIDARAGCSDACARERLFKIPCGRVATDRAVYVRRTVAFCVFHKEKNAVFRSRTGKFFGKRFLIHARQNDTMLSMNAHPLGTNLPITETMDRGL